MPTAQIFLQSGQKNKNSARQKIADIVNQLFTEEERTRTDLMSVGLFDLDSITLMKLVNALQGHYEVDLNPQIIASSCKTLLDLEAICTYLQLSAIENCEQPTVDIPNKLRSVRKLSLLVDELEVILAEALARSGLEVRGMNQNLTKLFEDIDPNSLAQLFRDLQQHFSGAELNSEDFASQNSVHNLAMLIYIKSYASCAGQAIRMEDPVSIEKWHIAMGGDAFDPEPLSGCLVCLSEGKSANMIPIVLVHGGDGFPCGFALTVTLNDSERPVYCFQAPEHIGNFSLVGGTVQDRARQYLSALLFHFDGMSSGAHLVGVSGGGALAYEIAVILQQKNIFCSVALVDSPDLRFDLGGKLTDLEMCLRLLAILSQRGFLSKSMLNDVPNALCKSCEEGCLSYENFRLLHPVLAGVLSTMLWTYLSCVDYAPSVESLDSKVQTKYFICVENHDGDAFTVLFSDYLRDNEVRPRLKGWFDLIPSLSVDSYIGAHAEFFDDENNVEALVKHIEETERLISK